MKTIIAGGRDYLFQAQDIQKLNELKDIITEVVSGCARGADTEGESGLNVTIFHLLNFPQIGTNMVSQRDIEEMKKWLDMPMPLFYFLVVKEPGICAM